MKHRVFAPAVGLLAVAFAIAGMATQARAADPSGIWAKDDGSAKLEVKKCGRGICSKIVWLRNPNDSRGRPLRDARNENPSMRDRPIMGLQLFSNMVLTAPNTWVGNVYNPEEGRVYTDVKVTMVSRQQIVLRGCRTWLLCGEKSWTKSRLPAEQEPIEVKAPAAPEAAPPEPPATREETIEANATPEPEAPVAEAARKTDAGDGQGVGEPRARRSCHGGRAPRLGSPEDEDHQGGAELSAHGDRVWLRARGHESGADAALRRQRVEHDGDDQAVAARA